MPYSSRPPSIRAYTGGSGHGVSGRGTYDSYPELIGYSSQVHPSHDIHGADNVYRDYREHSYYKSHEGYTSQDNHRSHQLFEGLREDASYNRQRKPTTHQSHRPSSDYQESSYFTHDDDEELYFSDDSFTDTRGSNYQRRASSAPRPRYSQEGHCSVPHVSHGRNHRDIGGYSLLSPRGPTYPYELV